ncbi:MAG: hypothetical protein GY767_22345 [Shimia sp.]|nr:hypothetical protein [Shimia sp.]
MNLFSGGAKQPASAPSPGIDEARARVDELRRSTRLRRRATGMLAAGSAPTAARQVTGN